MHINQENKTIALTMTDTVTIPPGKTWAKVLVLGLNDGEAPYSLDAVDKKTGQKYTGRGKIQVGTFTVPRNIVIYVGESKNVTISRYGFTLQPGSPAANNSTRFLVEVLDRLTVQGPGKILEVPSGTTHSTFKLTGLKQGATKVMVQEARTRAVKWIEVRVRPVASTPARDPCSPLDQTASVSIGVSSDPNGHTSSVQMPGTASVHAGIEDIGGGLYEFILNSSTPQLVMASGLLNGCPAMLGGNSASARRAAASEATFHLEGNSGSTAIAGFTKVPGAYDGSIAYGTGTEGPGEIGKISFKYTLGTGVFPGGPIVYAGEVPIAGEGGVACTYELDPIPGKIQFTGGTRELFLNTGPSCAWTVTSDAVWLTFPGESTGAGPAYITYKVAANDQTAERSGQITVSDQSITITQDGTSSTRPVIADAGVVNGASFSRGITPGEWISILGQKLSPVTRMWGDADFSGANLPTSLDGVGVTINGRPAYVFYISPGQLNVLVPDDDYRGPVDVVVTTPGGSSDPLEVYQGPVDPALFQFDPEGRRYAAAVHADGWYVGKDGLIPGAAFRPARPGDFILLFGTGFGQTDPPTPSGQLVSRAASLARPIVVRIGGKTAPQQFAGLSASGLDQINVMVPDLPPGDHLVEIFIDGVPIQREVYLTIGE